MITEVKAFQAGQLVFPTLQEAQKSELAALFDGMDDGTGHEVANNCAEAIVANADEIVAILTCAPKPKAPRKPRKDIGTKRKPKSTGPELEAK